jgi:S-adenosylmethionine:tRNA ribosyltransferase-isomerase
LQSFWPPEYSALDFELPENLIAAQPVVPADHARLMVIDRAAGTIRHDYFYNLPAYLCAGDAIFYNATRVEERRAYLRKPGGDKAFECVFLKIAPNPGPSPKPGGREKGKSSVPLPRLGEGDAEGRGRGEIWQVLMRNIRRLKDGQLLQAVKDAAYEFTLRRQGDRIYLESKKPLAAVDFARIGEMPIPPYMRRAAAATDTETYQNFFKEQIEQKDKISGSAASPTAALHFTPELFEKVKAGGVEFHPVCLDIGYGTFAPVTEDNFAQGKLHAEHYYIPPASAQRLQAAGGKKIALGTTSLRALLSLARYGATEGETEIFIKPGDAITGVDGLITNFHLPQSSLILLTAAFCGEKLLADAYREAIRLGYRFYSYGDAMLIL